ncbi:MAG: cytochrome c biogenesis protein ResB [Candidatus Marinimicrobia bacterium]|nr:cytochrome c biogenesis protein ResB [Candidatus Neomarinimicrobiota bacterium]
MKEIIKKIFLIVLAILVIFLILSTLFPRPIPSSELSGIKTIVHFFHLDRFYNSALNIALWSIITVLLLVSVFIGVIKNTAQKIVHLILALIFIVIIYEKSVNDRFNLILEEGETVQFADHIPSNDQNDSLLIHLEKFEIIRHQGSRMPRAFISHLVINRSDTVKLAVNEPMAYKHYRFYQSAYDRKFTCNIGLDQRKFSIALQDTLEIGGDTLVLVNYDHRDSQFSLLFNGDKYKLKPGKAKIIDKHKLIINPVGYQFVSIIEVAEVKAVGLLLVLSVIYLIFLYIALKREDK